MKYSYAAYLLLQKLDECESIAEEGKEEIHYLECNEKRINDLRKALKKLGYGLYAETEGDPSGGGGGPGSDGSGGNP